MTVPENYGDPRKRSIDLNVIVFRATTSNTERAAQFDLEGGPGFAVTESASFYAHDGEAYRHSRDVVLADMRGTGASNPLRCEGLERLAKAQPLSPLYPAASVAECRKDLAAVADVRQYSTQNAARDIDAIRQALNYDRLDLNAVSYGTTLALRYIALYPAHVRSAVLTGTVSADKTPPRFHATAATNGLEQIIDACMQNGACANQFPNLRSDLNSMLNRFGLAERDVYMEKLRAMLYLPATARQVPKVIHDAANGDVRHLSQPGAQRAFADGLYLSITCAESVDRMQGADAIAVADKTPFRAYRLRRQIEACKQWPKATRDPDLFKPTHSNVPILFISGEFDPVTPPAWTREVAKQFSNSTVVTVPQGGHVMEGMIGFESCLDPLILKFVANRSVSQSDLVCVQQMQSEWALPSAK